MTEKQIEQLKSLLASSNASDSSEELDQRIISAARAHQPQSKGVNRGLFKRLSVLPFRFLPSATAAIVLTAILFFGMGQMVSAPEREVASDSPTPTFSTDIPQTEPESAVDELLAVLKDGAFEPMPSQFSRNQILSDFDLPKTKELFANMEFKFDRDLETIELAMTDIASMIQVSEFDNARDRYAQLRQMCSTCELPNTLEALVLNVNEQPFGTG